MAASQGFAVAAAGFLSLSLALALPAVLASAQSSKPVQTTAGEEDEYEGLPPGIGRDDVFGFCGACHSMKIVTQQGLSRTRWIEVLDYMVEEQEMPELEPGERKLILDYLAKFYGPDRRARNMAR